MLTRDSPRDLALSDIDSTKTNETFKLLFAAAEMSFRRTTTGGKAAAATLYGVLRVSFSDNTLTRLHTSIIRIPRGMHRAY